MDDSVFQVHRGVGLCGQDNDKKRELLKACVAMIDGMNHCGDNPDSRILAHAFVELIYEEVKSGLVNSDFVFSLSVAAEDIYFLGRLAVCFVHKIVDDHHLSSEEEEATPPPAAAGPLVVFMRLMMGKYFSKIFGIVVLDKELLRSLLYLLRELSGLPTTGGLEIVVTDLLEMVVDTLPLKLHDQIYNTEFAEILAEVYDELCFLTLNHQQQQHQLRRRQPLELLTIMDTIDMKKGEGDPELLASFYGLLLTILSSSSDLKSQLSTVDPIYILNLMIRTLATFRISIIHKLLFGPLDIGLLALSESQSTQYTYITTGWESLLCAGLYDCGLTLPALIENDTLLSIRLQEIEQLLINGGLSSQSHVSSKFLLMDALAYIIYSFKWYMQDPDWDCQFYPRFLQFAKDSVFTKHTLEIVPNWTRCFCASQSLRLLACKGLTEEDTAGIIDLFTGETWWQPEASVQQRLAVAFSATHLIQEFAAASNFDRADDDLGDQLVQEDNTQYYSRVVKLLLGSCSLVKFLEILFWYYNETEESKSKGQCIRALSVLLEQMEDNKLSDIADAVIYPLLQKSLQPLIEPGEKHLLYGPAADDLIALFAIVVSKAKSPKHLIEAQQLLARLPTCYESRVLVERAIAASSVPSVVQTSA